MTDDDWIPFATARAILGGGKDPWPRLSRALVLAQVRSRGERAEDPGAGLVNLPAELWATWRLDWERDWLSPPGQARRRVPAGFVEVRFFRPDIEALSTSAPQTQVRPAARKRGPNQQEKLAGMLHTTYPDGRPAKRVDEIAQDLRSRAGTFSKRTWERAIKLAWPSG